MATDENRDQDQDQPSNATAGQAEPKNHAARPPAKTEFLPIPSPTWLAEEPAETSNLPLPNFRAEGQRELAGAWFVWLNRGVQQGQYAASTVSTYQQNLKIWVSFLEEIERTDRPSPIHVGNFVAALIPHRRPAAVNVLLHTVRSFYRWAESQEHYADIARSTKAIRVNHDGPLPALTHNEVVDLLGHIPDDEDLGHQRDRALVALLYGTGCRCISLERANCNDLDRIGGTLRHHPKGHRGADAQAQVPAASLQLLIGYLDTRSRTIGIPPEEAPLFVALDRGSSGRRLTTRSMRRIVLKLMELAGHARRNDEGELVNPGVYSAHSLRRSALTTAADVEGLEAAQSLAGHARIETTRKAYVRVKMHAKLKKVAGALNLIKH